MKRYYKDVFGEPTFIEVTLAEFEHDMMRFKSTDWKGIDIEHNRRVAAYGAQHGGKDPIHEEDADQVAFWLNHTNADICGSVCIKDFCDYYVVEEQVKQ